MFGWFRKQIRRETVEPKSYQESDELVQAQRKYLVSSQNLRDSLLRQEVHVERVISDLVQIMTAPKEKEPPP